MSKLLVTLLMLFVAACLFLPSESAPKKYKFKGEERFPFYPFGNRFGYGNVYGPGMGGYGPGMGGYGPGMGGYGPGIGGYGPGMGGYGPGMGGYGGYNSMYRVKG
ncbi:uncharacterized protein [Diabrotica undecimpunctata]|uniref:uncharacterized protein n=1 Tax=Diabrotica undecimpunctata TaxID=50387 RepID=UPI003B63AADD